MTMCGPLHQLPLHISTKYTNTHSIPFSTLYSHYVKNANMVIDALRHYYDNLDESLLSATGIAHSKLDSVYHLLSVFKELQSRMASREDKGEGATRKNGEGNNSFSEDISSIEGEESEFVYGEGGAGNNTYPRGSGGNQHLKLRISNTVGGSGVISNTIGAKSKSANVESKKKAPSSEEIAEAISRIENLQSGLGRGKTTSSLEKSRKKNIEEAGPGAVEKTDATKKAFQRMLSENLMRAKQAVGEGATLKGISSAHAHRSNNNVSISPTRKKKVTEVKQRPHSAPSFRRAKKQTHLRRDGDDDGVALEDHEDQLLEVMRKTLKVERIHLLDDRENGRREALRDHQNRTHIQKIIVSV
jgi:hypothetical protein